MIRWLLAPWHWQQRRLDLQILWPACKSEATNAGLSIDHAKAAFAQHCYRDSAWMCLGDDEIYRRVEALT